MSGRSTKQNYALKQLQHAVSGGRIITPDKAKENLTASVQGEVANLQVLRENIVNAMVQGLAAAIANGDVGPSNARDLIASADSFAIELMRLKCAEIEDIVRETKGKRTEGFKYLCALTGVEVEAEPTDRPAPQPTLIQAPAGA